MVSVIQVERDQEGVQQALRAVFEESFQRNAISESMRSADAETREAMLADLDLRALSPGYYARASYLLDLANAIQAGIHYSASQLTRDDVRGLLAVSRAKAEFEHDHPACSACGRRQDGRFAMKCPGCGAEFNRGNA